VGPGIYLLSRINIIFPGLFIIYLIALEISVYKEGWVCCYYYGKRCASGRGKIVSKIFKKDDPKKFCERQVTIKNFIPTLLVTIIPVVTGIYLLLQSFSYMILGLTIIPILVCFIGV